MFGKVILIGYGITGNLEGCTGTARHAIEECDLLIFRWDKDPIYQEISNLRPGAVKSMAHLYEEHYPYHRIYEAIFEAVVEAARKGGTIGYVTPGDPLTCEATAFKLYRFCRKDGIEIAIIPGVSFIGFATSVLGIDITEGTQIFAGTEITDPQFQAEISGKLKLIVASVSPDPVREGEGSELESFLAFLEQRYEPERRVWLVSATPGEKDNIRANVKETTIGHIRRHDEFLRRCRVTYIVDGVF